MKSEIADALVSWYGKAERGLPWRESRDPYRIWISEIMLQQTRARSVIPYYQRFLENCPDVRSLAACSDERLMKLWEGLGYYSRARNLKRAARIISEKYDGVLPDSSAELESLPGIGPYTAGAIASIAFGEPVPAVDGNALRVFSRIFGIREDIQDLRTRKQITEKVREIIPEDNPGIFNQAVMDLGACLCLPTGEARCGECPVRFACYAGANHLTGQIPVRRKKPRRTVCKKTILVIRDGLNFLLRKRPDEGLLAGLYELPSFEGHLKEEEVRNRVREAGLSPVRIQKLEDAKHIFTHLEWHMSGYLILVEELPPRSGTCFLASRQEIEGTFAIPSAFAAYRKYIKVQ